MARDFGFEVDWEDFIRKTEGFVSEAGEEIEKDLSRQIANAHTGFNITMTLIWVPLIWLMVKRFAKNVTQG